MKRVLMLFSVLALWLNLLNLRCGFRFDVFRRELSANRSQAEFQEAWYEASVIFRTEY